MQPGPILIFACPQCGAFSRDCFWASYNTFGATLWTDGKLMGDMVSDEPPITRCHRCSNYFWTFSARILCSIGGDQMSVDEKLAWDASTPTPTLTPNDFLKALRARSEWTKEQEIVLRICLWRAQNDREREEQQPKVGGSLDSRQRMALAPADRHLSPEQQAEKLAEFQRKWLAEYPDMSEDSCVSRRRKMLMAARLGKMDEAKRISDIDCPPKDGPEFADNLKALIPLLNESEPQERIALAEIARELGDFGRVLKLTQFDYADELWPAAATIQDFACQRDRRVRPIPALKQSPRHADDSPEDAHKVRMKAKYADMMIATLIEPPPDEQKAKEGRTDLAFLPEAVPLEQSQPESDSKKKLLFMLSLKPGEDLSAFKKRVWEVISKQLPNTAGSTPAPSPTPSASEPSLAPETTPVNQPSITLREPTPSSPKLTIGEVLDALGRKLRESGITETPDTEAPDSSPNTPQVAVTFYNSPRKSASDDSTTVEAPIREIVLLGAEARIGKLRREILSLEPFYQAHKDKDFLRWTNYLYKQRTTKARKARMVFKSELISLGELHDAAHENATKLTRYQTLKEELSLLIEEQADEPQKIGHEPSPNDVPKGRYRVEVMPGKFAYYETRKAAREAVRLALPKCVEVYDYANREPIYAEPRIEKLSREILLLEPFYHAHKDKNFVGWKNFIYDQWKTKEGADFKADLVGLDRLHDVAHANLEKISRYKGLKEELSLLLKALADEPQELGETPKPIDTPKERYGVEIEPGKFAYYKTRRGALAAAQKILPKSVAVYDFATDETIHEEAGVSEAEDEILPED